jgi:hypothetical protein
MKRNYPLWENASEADRRAIYEVYVKNFHDGYDFFDDEPMTFEEFNECHHFSTFRSVKHFYTGEWK